MKKEYDLSKLKEVKNLYPGKKKKAVGINLSHEVIDYFKKLSDENSIPYQTLIDLYLQDCVKNKKKPNLDWAAWEAYSPAPEPASDDFKKSTSSAGSEVGSWKNFFENGSLGRTRTCDQVINSHLLYRLSYQRIRGSRY